MMHTVKALAMMLILSGFVLAACSGQPPAPAQAVYPVPETEVVTIMDIEPWIVMSSIRELAHASDLVVIGQIISDEGYMNAGSDARDISGAEARLVSVNRLYSVSVERVIEGDSETTLLLAQFQGTLRLASDQVPTLQDLEAEAQRRQGTVYLPLSMEKRYLFFLREIDGFDGAKLYTAASEPWMFAIQSDGVTVAETVVTGSERAFPPLPLEKMIEESGKPYTPGEKVPYPEPAGEELRGGTPYP